jgi:NitT/TauT family transport system substrate-binding protein
MKTLTRPRALALLASGAALAYAAPARSQNAKLRLAVVPTDSYMEAYYALDAGFFAKAGLDVEIQTLTSGGAIANALAGGAIDVGQADPIQVAAAVNRGVPFRYFAGGSLYSSSVPSTQLCVAQNGPIKTAKDLQGQTVGVFGLGSMPEFSTRAWVGNQGLDASGVKFVEIPPPVMVPAIQRGTIAAGLVAEPQLSRAPESGVVPFAKVYDSCAKVFYINSWFANADWLAQNAETARKLSSVIYAVARWTQTHRAESLAILAKRGKIDLGIASTMTRSLFDTALDPKKIQPPLDLAWRFHGLTKEVSAADISAKL